LQAAKIQKIQWINQFEEAAILLAHKGFAEVTFKGLGPVLGQVIVTLEGEAHRQRRSLEGQLFVAALLQTQERELLPAIIEDSLQPYVVAGGGCLVQISQAVTSRVAARLIGLDTLEDPPLIGHWLGALVGGTSIKHPAHPTLTRRQARELLYQNLIDKAIARRHWLIQAYQAGQTRREDLPLDLITLLLLHPDQWTLSQVQAEAAFYAVAGIDTTATLMPHLMHGLWELSGQQAEYLTSFQDLSFLRSAAAEALRLHPVLPTLFRQATQAVTVSGKSFEAGEVVGLHLGKANLDEKVFGPNSTEFKPLRSLKFGTRRAGLSFGGGRHLCMGRELALGTPEAGQEHKLFGEAALLAQALFRYRARPDPAHPVQAPQPGRRDAYQTYPILLG